MNIVVFIGLNDRSHLVDILEPRKMKKYLILMEKLIIEI